MGNSLKQNNTSRLTKSGNYRKREGITLVETLAALVVLALFFTGSSKSLMAYRQLSDKSRDHYMAINIAKNRIELIRTFDFDQFDDFEEVDTLVDHTGTPDRNGKYQRSTTFANASSNLMEVVVTVGIKDRKTLSFDSEQELSTYLAYYLTESSSVGSGTN